jgi:hypothetical protein
MSYNNIIYPTNLSKYKGTLKGKKVTIDGKVTIFETVEQAKKYFVDINDQKGWIKNKIYEYDDHLKVDILDKQMLADKEDLNLIQRLILRIDKDGYVVTTIKNKNVFWHNLIMLKSLPSDTYTVDHINRIRLDNRRINLRAASKTTQSTNRGLHAHNKTGITGVFLYDKKGRGLMWVAKWFVDGEQQQRSFMVKKYGYEEAKKLAILARDIAVKEFYLNEK